jgi:hypothetical protein
LRLKISARSEIAEVHGESEFLQSQRRGTQRRGEDLVSVIAQQAITVREVDELIEGLSTSSIQFDFKETF